MLQKREAMLIVTGELSGELHALEFIRQTQSFNFSFYGMGGEVLAKAGVNLLVNTKDFHVMGINELLKSIKKIYSAWQTLKNFILENKPVVVLVDYPDFNLRLAKVAKQAGCKVLYLISPTIWAWRPNRIKLIKKFVDRMMVIYPFEVAYYRQRGVTQVHYVGNVLLKSVEQHEAVETLRQRYHLKKEIMTLGLFPGSRVSELKNLLPAMLATAQLLTKQMPLQLVLPKALSIREDFLNTFLTRYPNLKIVVLSNAYDAITLSDVILAASGTVTLEIALSEKPLIIVYRGKWWEYQLAKRWLKIKNIGLCNILAGNQVAPEFLQDQVSPPILATALLRLLNSNEQRQKQIVAFRRIKEEFLNTPVVAFSQILKELSLST